MGWPYPSLAALPWLGNRVIVRAGNGKTDKATQCLPVGDNHRDASSGLDLNRILRTVFVL
jgi:hypothetical protein